MQLGSLPPTNVPPPGYQNVPLPALHGAGSGAGPALSRVTRTDPGLLRYAMQSFGTTNLSEEDWKKAEDHYKVLNIKCLFIYFQLWFPFTHFMCNSR